jgi:predicted enzyme related to lactoylglutathione lyase
MEAIMARLSYVELPAKATRPLIDFYAGAFGYTFTDYGPDYAATTNGDVDIGLNASAEHAIALVLPIIQVEDLEAALESVVANGGTITLPIFPYPGGRRFHFRDPEGNELGVCVVED